MICGEVGAGVGWDEAVAKFLFRAGGEQSVRMVAMAERLRRQTRNLLGQPAQVQVLLATFFTSTSLLI